MIIGALTFLAIYGIAPLNPFNDSFIVNGYMEKDVAQHYAGWRLYRNSPWQFPLGVGANMEYPYGGAVSYSDSIPLFAIFFKAISFILPETFQYFGLFVFICFLLQGVFAALLISLFCEHLLFTSVATFFFTFSPIMIERAFRHCALTAHFIILASLYYYFKNKKINGAKALLPFFIINCLAISIHPYFLPFTFAVMFAFCLERFFKLGLKLQSVLGILSSIGITLATGYIIGAFHIKGSLNELGYGYFNMNLNAFFNPISKNTVKWSKFLPERPLLNGQLEGFNYLGIGIIVLCAMALLLLIIKYHSLILQFIVCNFGLVFSAVCLTLFAIGDYVSFGGLQLFRFPLSEFIIVKICSIFRANGRFGNFLYYLLFLFALYMIFKIKNAKLLLTVLVVSLCVQLYDISGVLMYKHSYFSAKAIEAPQYVAPVAQHVFWDDAIQIADGVIEMESENGAMFGNGLIDIASKCGKYNKYINSTFAARTSGDLRAELLLQEKQSIIDGTSNTILYVVEEINFFFDLIDKNEYQAFEVDGQPVVIKTSFSQEKIDYYTSLGNFKQLR